MKFAFDGKTCDEETWLWVNKCMYKTFETLYSLYSVYKVAQYFIIYTCIVYNLYTENKHKYHACSHNALKQH